MNNTRSMVVEKYREYLYQKLEKNEITISDILSLEGKRLGCFCHPHQCHGDVIVEVFNDLVSILEEEYNE